MLILESTVGESIMIYPSEDISPGMTVQELLSAGSLEIQLKDFHKGKAKIGLSIPLESNVIRKN